MKKLILVFSMLFIAGIFQVVSAQSVLDFKIVNKTGMDLYGVYVTDANTTDWGKDILPSDIVADGGTIEVSFTDEGDQTCEWDMKLTEDASEETSVVIYGLNLCNVSVVTIFIEDGKYKYITE